MSPPILVYPKKEARFILDTDASLSSIGAVLSQEIDGNESVIAYASHKLTKAEQNYCATRRELLAVVRYVKQFHHYLVGKQFTIRNDHKVLQFLMSWKQPSSSQYLS